MCKKQIPTNYLLCIISIASVVAVGCRSFNYKAENFTSPLLTNESKFQIAIDSEPIATSLTGLKDPKKLKGIDSKTLFCSGDKAKFSPKVNVKIFLSKGEKNSPIDEGTAAQKNYQEQMERYLKEGLWKELISYKYFGDDYSRIVGNRTIYTAKSRNPSELMNENIANNDGDRKNIFGILDDEKNIYLTTSAKLIRFDHEWHDSSVNLINPENRINYFESTNGEQVRGKFISISKNSYTSPEGKTIYPIQSVLFGVELAILTAEYLPYYTIKEQQKIWGPNGPAKVFLDEFYGYLGEATPTRENPHHVDYTFSVQELIKDQSDAWEKYMATFSVVKKIPIQHNPTELSYSVELDMKSFCNHAKALKDLRVN